MAKLTTPTSIQSVRVDKTITLSWDKADDADKSEFAYHFVSKTTDKDLPLPAGAVAAAVTGTDKRQSCVITFKVAKDVTDLKDYLGQVKATPNAAAKTAGDTDSDFGTESVWLTNPSITIKIGDNTYTLSQDSMAGPSSIYRLPVSKDNPLLLKYDDLKAFAAKMSVTLPDNYPSGKPITGELQIFEFVVDTAKKLFALDISAKLEWEIFSGFSVERMGLVLKRTDKSL
jgi:hypothetical protein